MELTELPNIGPVLADNPRRARVSSAEALRSVGACEAWLRIRARVDSGACLHQLTALAGADAGIPQEGPVPGAEGGVAGLFDRVKT